MASPATASSPQEELVRLESHLAADPNNPRLLARAIDAALAAGSLTKARRHADAALAAAPGDPYLKHRQGNVLLAEGKLDAAGDIFARLLVDHRDPHIAYSLAQVRFRQQRFDDALTALMPLEDNTPAAAVALAIRVLHRQGNVPQARQMAQAHLKRCGDSAEYLAVASLAFLDDDETAQAEELAQASLAKGQRLPEALVVCGYAAVARRDAAAAHRFFDESLRMAPRDARSLAGKGMASLLAADAQGAKLMLAQAVQQQPDNAEMLQALGWAHLMAHDVAAAEAAFKRLASLPQSREEAHGGLAVTYALQGRRDEATKAIAQLKNDDPAGQLAKSFVDGDPKAIAKLQELATRALRSR
jgi:predicted Zn-dependent protease